jgi:hypothetical protein
MMGTHSIIKQLTKQLFGSPLGEERITELKPIDYVRNYYHSPFLGFEDPRDGKKQILEWNSDKERVKELKRINKLIAEYNKEADANSKEWFGMLPKDGMVHTPSEVGYKKPTVPIGEHPLWAVSCVPYLSRDRDLSPLWVDDENLYHTFLELSNDDFVEYLNKEIFKYIQTEIRKAKDLEAWDSDNMWYEPNKRFVKWFQIKNIDPDSKVLKKDDTNNALWAIADDMRDRKDEGQFDTYMDAYRWAEKNISKKEVNITAKKLERAYHKAKSEGKVN